MKVHRQGCCRLVVQRIGGVRDQPHGLLALEPQVGAGARGNVGRKHRLGSHDASFEQVAPQTLRKGLRPLLAWLPCPASDLDGKHRASLGAPVLLPPQPQEGAHRLGHLEPIGGAGLASRDEGLREVHAVNHRPVPRHDVARAHAPEHAGNQAHHADLKVDVGGHEPCKFVVGQDGALLDDLPYLGHLDTIHGVGFDELIAPCGLEDATKQGANVPQALTLQPAC